MRLRRLSLSENEISRIPLDIASLINLVELDLSKNEVTDIPENIKFLRSLQVANFSQNPISRYSLSPVEAACVSSCFRHLITAAVVEL